MSNEENKKNRQIKALLEEWKQNITLYVDQDKRGFARIQMFLAINGGLLLLFQYVPAPVRILVGFVAIYICVRTQLMSREAHKYIILRRVQGMLVEENLKELIAKGETLSSSTGVVTTFSREHAVFLPEKELEEKGKSADELEKLEKWKSLREEIEKTLGSYPAGIFFGKWKKSIKHLKWLESMFYALYVLWAGLIVFAVVKSLPAHMVESWDRMSEWLCELLC